MDVVDGEVQAHARVGFHPNRGQVSAFAFLVAGSDIYGLKEAAVDPSRVHGLDLRGEGWRLSLTPLDPGTRWRLDLEGELTRSPSPQAALEGQGEPAEVDLTLDARGRHPAFRYSEGRDFPDMEGFGRYEQACDVEGTASLDGTTYELAGPGERDHSWGRRKWTGRTRWLWASGGFEDGTAFNLLSYDVPGIGEGLVNGFWFDGDEVHPLTEIGIDAQPGLDEAEVDAWTRGKAPELGLTMAWAGGEAEVSAEALGTTPLRWEDDEGDAAVMVRSPTRMIHEGVPGGGWVERKLPA